jgi:hypothetical protein
VRKGEDKVPGLGRGKGGRERGRAGGMEEERDLKRLRRGREGGRGEA